MLFKKRKIASFEVVTLRLGGMREPCEYEIVCGGQTSEITAYALRRPDGGERERVPEESAVCPTDEALAVLNRCGVLLWDGFYGSHPRGVMDGTSFVFTAKVDGGREIKASGSQNFPRHFHDLCDYIGDRLRGD